MSNTSEAATPGVIGADNTSIRLDLDNEPQPDCILFIAPECGGQVRITEDDYVEGSPELVAEVTSSTVSYDLGDKRDAFRRNGVCEYIVWRVLDGQIDWFILREGRYERLEPQGGCYRSEAFPGLWLDADAMLAGDLARVLDVLREGLAADHAELVGRLDKLKTSTNRA